MSAATPSPAAEIETARERIAAANSLDEIEAIVEHVSAAGTREGAVLFSGPLGNGVYSGDVATHLADRLNASTIDETPRGSFLGNKEIERTIRTTAMRIFEREGEDPIAAERSAGSFLFGDANARPEAVTSVETRGGGAPRKTSRGRCTAT